MGKRDIIMTTTPYEYKAEMLQASFKVKYNFVWVNSSELCGKSLTDLGYETKILDGDKAKSVYRDINGKDGTEEEIVEFLEKELEKEFEKYVNNMKNNMNMF